MSINNQKTRDLLNVALSLKNKDEAKCFLRDLLTESEIKEFANRWLAARMLNEKISYTNIQKKTGLSTTTIARISKWLQKGKGGYRLVLNRMKHYHRKSPSRKRLR